MLDIGGKETIKVSRSLLTRVKGSALEAMFSGRHQLKALPNGAIFVDRDADVFEMVITYLRRGCKYPTIADQALKERFEDELDFWQLKTQTD